MNEKKNLINLILFSRPQFLPSFKKHELHVLFPPSWNEITQFFPTHSVPYMGKGTFTVIVNQTENKAKTASCDSQFFIPGFPASKLRAEKLVLSSYGRKLSNGEGKVIKKCIYGIKFPHGMAKCINLYVGCLLVVGSSIQSIFYIVMRFNSQKWGRLTVLSTLWHSYSYMSRCIYILMRWNPLSC